MLLPGHQRSAVLQSICLRNMIQNLTTELGTNVFPVFAAGKCRSLLRLGMKSVVAGTPRRPHLPNAKETMTFVAGYLSKLNGVALDQLIFIYSSSPLVSMNLHLLNARMHMRHSSNADERGLLKWVHEHATDN